MESVAAIACEDTRRTARLLARFGIATPTLSCHKFNERSRLESVLGLLREGRDVALVSDGGTPGISDPGALLVRAARAAGFRVVPVPGPSAAIALLSASGVAADRFVFDGFLPHRSGERRRRLREIRDEARATVVFETPHRLREALDDMAEVLGERRIVLGRELTKLHETILEGTPSSVAAALGTAPIRGEIAIVIDAATDRAERARPAVEAGERRLIETWRRHLEGSGGDRRRALRDAARELGFDRPELQRRLAELGLD